MSTPVISPQPTTYQRTTHPKPIPRRTSTTTKAQKGCGSPRGATGRNRKLFSNVECYKCNRKGHYANQCPTTNKEGVQLLISGMEIDQAREEEDILDFNFMHQQDINSLPRTSVLIDTGSTVSVFKNKEALRNITRSRSALHEHKWRISRLSSTR